MLAARTFLGLALAAVLSTHLQAASSKSRFKGIDPAECQLILTSSSVNAMVIRKNADGIAEFNIVEQPWKIISIGERNAETAPKAPSLAVLADGSYSLAYTEKNAVMLFDSSSGAIRTLGELPWTEDIISISATRGRLPSVVGLGRSTIYLWDPDNGLLLSKYSGSTDFDQITPSIDGNFIAAAAAAAATSESSHGHSKIVFFSISETGLLKPIATSALSKKIVSIVMPARKPYALTIDESGSVDAWNINTGDHVGRLYSNSRGDIIARAISPDGRLFVQVDARNSLSICEFGSKTARVETPVRFDGDVSKLLISPNNRYLLVAGGKNLWVLDIVTGASMTATSPFELGHGDASSQTLAFSPDETKLFTLSPRGELLEWDLDRAFTAISTPSPSTDSAQKAAQ